MNDYFELDVSDKLGDLLDENNLQWEEVIITLLGDGILRVEVIK